MPKTPQNEVAWRAQYPFASRWIGVPGGRMHYVDEGPTDYRSAGSRATLLFVHGNPTWSFHWRRLIVALRPKYRCVAMDHIGCGLSEKPPRYFALEDHVANLVALVNHLELPRLTLVAQDWGGAIGLGAMLRVPEQLERIILFNTGAFPPRLIPWRIRACRIPVVGRLAVQGANLFSLAALRMTIARQRQLAPDVAAGYLAPYDSWSNRRAVYGFVKDIPRPRRGAAGANCAELRSDSDLECTGRLLAQIESELPRFADRPAALVWGMRDWCFQPDCLDRFVAVWPNAEVHRLEDVGHWVVEDAPNESLAILEEFLARTSVETGVSAR